MSSDKETHWQSVYQSKAPGEVSWFKPHLDVSLALLLQAGLNANSRVIDIGAGASTLVDDLLDLGVRHITALANLFSPGFTLVDSRHEVHATPWGAPQSFAYALLRKIS